MDVKDFYLNNQMDRYKYILIQISMIPQEFVNKYRDSVKLDPPVWTNSMCNELGPLYQGWKSHAGTDTIEFIFHKDKPKDRKATYVRAVCNIRPQKTETHRTRLTAGGKLIDYPGEVSTPKSDLTTMKLHINSNI